MEADRTSDTECDGEDDYDQEYDDEATESIYGNLRVSVPETERISINSMSTNDQASALKNQSLKFSEVHFHESEVTEVTSAHSNIL